MIRANKKQRFTRFDQKSNGFTIIELMLAMLFVSFILVFMALTLVQMLRTYDKAISMKQINQAGRTITEDISKAMRSQGPSTVTTDYVNTGLLCIGTTVYQWNPVFQGGESFANATVPTSDPTATDAIVGPTDGGGYMVRKKFTAQRDCTAANANNASQVDETSTMPLLSNRARVVWANATPYDNKRLVKLTFIIGTHNRNELDSAVERANMGKTVAPFDFSGFGVTPHREDGQPTCLPGNDGNYCAFATFETIVYVSKDEQ